MRLREWENPKQELLTRLRSAKQARIPREKQWRDSERLLYGSTMPQHPSVGIATPDGDVLGSVSTYASDPDDSGADSDINYVHKNVRFIHSQLATNPPSVVPKPTSSDQADRRRADAAERLLRYSSRQYTLKEKTDLTALNAIVYGVGILKHHWDAMKGDIIGYSEGELELSGDLDVRLVHPWRFYPDPDADTWEEVRYVFEEIHMPWDEAIHRFPDKEEVLKQWRKQVEATTSSIEDTSSGNRTSLEDVLYDSVTLFQYWERGYPYNGFMGRYALITPQGELIDGVRENPNRFTIPDDGVKWPEDKELPKIAQLPYSFMSDIDVPDTVWARSFVEYAGPLQDYLNEMDTIALENSRAHGVVRGVVPKGTDLSELTDSAWQLLPVSGVERPTFMNPPAPMPEMHTTRNHMRVGIDDMAGVNESMFGQQSREMAGFAMQYATNQGNMIRHRLFIKYANMVESMYRQILHIFVEHWTEPRTIKVLGQEQAFETVDLSSSDIRGGYDLQVEYGTAFSLDPMTRRQEILTLIPQFEKAGISPNRILELMRLNDLPGIYDENKLAMTRQQEVFDRMIATGAYIEPKKIQDHQRMLDWAYVYVMTSEFETLPEELQMLIYAHIEQREGRVAERAQAAAGQAAPGGAPGPAPSMTGQEQLPADLATMDPAASQMGVPPEGPGSSF